MTAKWVGLGKFDMLVVVIKEILNIGEWEWVTTIGWTDVSFSSSFLPRWSSRVRVKGERKPAEHSSIPGQHATCATVCRANYSTLLGCFGLAVKTKLNVPEGWLGGDEGSTLTQGFSFQQSKVNLWISSFNTRFLNKVWYRGSMPALTSIIQSSFWHYLWRDKDYLLHLGGIFSMTLWLKGQFQEMKSNTETRIGEFLKLLSIFVLPFFFLWFFLY